MPVVGKRLESLPPYVFAVIGDRIRKMTQAGIDVIRLDIGSPDMPPPNIVMDTLKESAYNEKNHGYSGYRGTATFRQAVADYYKRRFDVTLDPDKEVLPVIGSKEGLVNIALAYIDTGDIALIPDIGYPSYSMGTRLAGGDIHYMPIRAENDYLPVFGDIPQDVLNKSKLLWLNYPNNPTGAVAPLEFYQEAVEFCAKHDIIATSDNPYVDLTYDDYVAPSIMQVPGAKETAIEFMSLSKTYNMAGWRLGAAVGNADALSALLKVKSNMDSGHFKPVYDAGVTALTQISDEWLQERNAIYQKRRDAVVAALSEIGMSGEAPKASLYVWAVLNEGDPEDYVKRALEEAHVSMAPGTAYGPGGANNIRFSLVVPEERIAEAMSRLKAWHSA